MWSTSHTIDISAQPDKVWAIWADAANWAKLDENIAASKLDGPLEEGATGEITLKGGGTGLAITVVECDPGTRFAYQAETNGITIKADHSVESTSDGCKVSMTLEMEGMAVFLIAPTLGKKLEEQLPVSMGNLKKLVEGL